jgi:hypothetical protein
MIVPSRTWTPRSIWQLRRPCLLLVAIVSLFASQAAAGAVPGQGRRTEPLARVAMSEGAATEVRAAMPVIAGHGQILALARLTLAPGASIDRADLGAVVALSVERGRLDVAVEAGGGRVDRATGTPAEWVGAGQVATLSAGDGLSFGPDARLVSTNTGATVAVVWIAALVPTPFPIEA